MQKRRLFVDSSAIIYGLECPQSNSSTLLRLIRDKKLRAATSEKALREVKAFLALKRGEKLAYCGEVFVKRNFTIIGRKEIEAEVKTFRGRIKEKDLEHLATAKKLGARIVALDRDYAPFKEYVTPKQLVRELGLKPRDTEY